MTRNAQVPRPKAIERVRQAVIDTRRGSRASEVDEGYYAFQAGYSAGVEATEEKYQRLTEEVGAMDHARDCRGGEDQGPPGIAGREVWGICNCAKSALAALEENPHA